MITRATQEKKYLKAIREDNLNYRTILLGIWETRQAFNPFDEHAPNWFDSSAFYAEDMHKHLNNIFGKHTGVTQGKSLRAKVWFLEFEGQTIMAKNEQGGVGTGWYWVQNIAPREYGVPDLFSFDPEVKHWLPQFSRELEVLSQPKKLKP